MENEIRYYLEQISMAIKEEAFEPHYLVIAVMLPECNIELQIIDRHITEKIAYILDAYNDNMVLKTNENISIRQIMVV